MKRYLLLLLALAMICLWGCQKEMNYAGTTPTTQAPATEPSQKPEPEPEPEPEPKPEVLYRNPLNGYPLDAPWEGRPTAVVINNLIDALPHHGTADADFLYEVETESDITRMLAIYDDMTLIDKIGPVRSSRTFFNNIAVSYDAPIVHCGGSVKGRNAGYDDSYDKIDNWAHLDAAYYENLYFYRDNDRYKYQGYNWEHCLFTNSELLTKGLAERDLATPTERSSDFGLQFDDDVVLEGEDAASVTVSFRGSKTTTFTYDPEIKNYKTAQYGEEYIDANTGDAVVFRNVLVLYTDQWIKGDGEYPRSYYNLTGEGEGHLAIDGKIVPIKWSREGLRTNFAYTLEDGTPVTLAAGHTYVAITSNTDTQYQ